MGEEVLVEMAREDAKKLRDNLTVDWAVRDSVSKTEHHRTLLRKYKYPQISKRCDRRGVAQAELVAEHQAA